MIGEWNDKKWHCKYSKILWKRDSGVNGHNCMDLTTAWSISTYRKFTTLLVGTYTSRNPYSDKAVAILLSKILQKSKCKVQELLWLPGI